MQRDFQKRGVILIVSTLILGVLLILGAYFLSFTLTESKITKSQDVATQTYYLAEAGINEAIWKLKYDNTEEDGDDPWAVCFISSTAPCTGCDNWSATFTTSTAELVLNSSITVTIENSECGRGRITATSTITLSSGKTAQRVVKTSIFKALGSLTAKSVLFAGANTGESSLEDLTIYVHNGNIAVRGDFRVEHSTLKVYDDADPESQTGLILAGKKIYISGSSITASSTCSTSTCGGFCPTNPDDYCPFGGGGCPCTKLPPLPAVDFNSTSSSSYYQKAKTAQENGQCEVEGKDKHGHTFTSPSCIFTYDGFRSLLDKIGSGETLTLKYKASALATSTYYIVGGGFNLIGGRNLQVNGVLVTEGTVNIGTDFSGGGCSNGWSQLTISHSTSTPSGLFTTRKIYFGPCATYPWGGPTTLTGLIYALEELNIEDVMGEYKITGGIITNKFTIHAKKYDLYLDDDIIEEGIWGGPKLLGEEKPLYSPVVTIEHWEEAY